MPVAFFLPEPVVGEGLGCCLSHCAMPRGAVPSHSPAQPSPPCESPSRRALYMCSTCPADPPPPGSGLVDRGSGCVAPWPGSSFWGWRVLGAFASRSIRRSAPSTRRWSTVGSKAPSRSTQGSHRGTGSDSNLNFCCQERKVREMILGWGMDRNS